MRQVTIIGAGVVGVCSALFLQRDGWAVTLIDRLAPAAGASFGNAGNISPGAVVPFSMPSVWSQIPKWLVDPAGPFTIRFGELFRLLPWFFAWARASREREVFRISAAMHALHGPTFEAYEELTRGTPAERYIERTGQLYVSQNHDAAGSGMAKHLRGAAGVKAEVLNARQLHELEPALASRIPSGLLLPDNGRCLDPHGFVCALAEEAVRCGAKIIRGDVISFEVEGTTVNKAILSDNSRVDISEFVIAAGIDSAAVLKELGCRVPLRAERGYHITLRDSGIVLQRPITNIDGHFVAQSMECGMRFAGTVEFAAPNAQPNWKRADLLLRQASAMFPQLREAPASNWCGSRPSLPDGLPILDRMRSLGNVHLAFGNSHYGMTAAPVMGRAVAAMMSGRPTELPMREFSLCRFQ